jgi:ketosteroid isomerase-like protein
MHEHLPVARMVFNTDAVTSPDDIRRWFGDPRERQPALDVAPADPAALDVAAQAFAGLQRGAATGDWSGFVGLLADDARIMIPVPPDIPDPPEGVLVGKDIARQLFGRHHEEKVEGAALECKRVTASGNVVVMECRVEGKLNGELVANYFVFSFEIAGGQVASMYEYAIWTAKHPASRWSDVTFAREAFGASVIG